jgi:serine/threonine-protein kinase RsbT
MKQAELATGTRISVASEQDIVRARMRGRAMAMELGFPAATATLVATAISELARNILLYARRGEIVLSALERDARHGIEITAGDEGPGIQDVTRALEDGYSTSGRLGLGLPGVRRLMDSFEIDSRPGAGTSVRVQKWND